MQTVGTLPIRKTRKVHHRTDQTRYSQRSEQEKADYGAQRCRNSFLKTSFAPIAPQNITRDWGGEVYNYVTQANYHYLVQSAMKYAELLNIELKHNPGRSIGEGISNIYDELNSIIGNINLNIDPNADKLEFTLWKYHPWGDYTFLWLPVKFIEDLNPQLQKIALTFIHNLMQSNGMSTLNDMYDFEWVLDWAKEGLCECEEEDRETNEQIIKSYESGKIFRLMERIEKKSYYKNIPDKLVKYVPNNEFEEQLINLFKEGLSFIGKDKPSIMSYGYDPYYDEEMDYHPVDMDRMIRIVYDLDDFMTYSLSEWANSELREAYDISPVTQMALSPETSRLFSMDNYPDQFFKWFDKLCTLIS